MASPLLSPHSALILPLPEYSHFHACPTSTSLPLSPSSLLFELITFSFPVDSTSYIQHLHLSICSKCRKKPLSLLPRLGPHRSAFSAFLRKSRPLRRCVYGARYSYKQLNSQMSPPTSERERGGFARYPEWHGIQPYAAPPDPFGHEK